MLIQLPGGIQQSDGVWTKEVLLREMSTREEDILADMTKNPGKKKSLKVPMREKQIRILSRCTDRIGEEVRPDGKTGKDLPDYFYTHWKKAFLSDRYFAWVRLRQESVVDGDTFAFSTKCPHCEQKLPDLVEVDLYTLKVNSLPLEEVNHDRTFTLPFSGTEITWNELTGEQEEALEALMSTNLDKVSSGSAALRIRTIGGKKPKEEDILNISKKDREMFKREISTHDFGLDLSLETECPCVDEDGEVCGKMFTDRVPIYDLSFFFPTSETLSL